MQVTASVAAGRRLAVTNNEPPSVQTTSLTSGQVGVAYTQTLVASGASSPYTWQHTSGALPPGMNPLTSGGVLDGTPTTMGTYTFTVTATSANGAVSLPQTLSVTIAAAPVAAVTKPDRIFGTMSWVDPTATTNGTNWNKAKTYGGDGWILSRGYLPGYGGNTTPSWILNLPAEDATRPMGMAFYAMNYYNAATPFVPWFDDAAWTTLAARWGTEILAGWNNGYLLFGLDGEPYGTTNGNPGDVIWSASATASRYSKTVTQVRDKVKQRGEQLAAAIIAAIGTGNLKFVMYYMRFPDTWGEVALQWATAPFPNLTVNRDDGLQIDFVEGFQNASGLDELTLLESKYYKDPEGQPAPNNAQYFTYSMVDYDVPAYRAIFERWSHGDICHYAPFCQFDTTPNESYSAYRGIAHITGQMNAAKQAVQHPDNYAPLIAIYEKRSFSLDPQTGYGTGAASPGALPGYGIFSRRLGTAPASY